MHHMVTYDDVGGSLVGEAVVGEVVIVGVAVVGAIVLVVCVSCVKGLARRFAERIKNLKEMY